MAITKYDETYAELEKKGEFNKDVTPYNYDHTIKVDGDYVYINRKLSFRILSGCIRGLMLGLGPLVNSLLFGCKIVGRENFDAVKETGCFSISNHVNYLDNLMMRQAIGLRKRYYLTVGDFNSKSGFAGLMLRSGGVLPLPPENCLSGMRNLNVAFKELLADKRIIHFYPEQSMWMNFRKPRPFKKGSFHYAVKYNVPVVPMFFCYSKPTGIRKLFKASYKVTLFVMPALYPDKSLPLKERENDLHRRAMDMYIRKYREFYKVDDPLIYDIDPSNYATMPVETELACKVSAETVGLAFDRERGVYDPNEAQEEPLLQAAAAKDEDRT